MTPKTRNTVVAASATSVAMVTVIFKLIDNDYAKRRQQTFDNHAKRVQEICNEFDRKIEEKY